MATIGEIAVNLVARTTDFTSGLSQGKASLQSFGKSALSMAASVGAAFGGLWTMQNALSSYLQVGDELQKLAIRTGVAAEALSQLRYAADLSDVSMQQMQTSLIMLSRNMTRPTKAFTETLQAMGLTLADLAGKGGDSQLEIIADGLLRMRSEAERAAAATRIFGRAGAEMLPLLADGSKGIQAMRAEAEKLGLTMSSDMANAAAKFNDQMSAIKNALSGFAMQVGALVVPVLSRIAGWLVSLDKTSIRFGLSFAAAGTGFILMARLLPIVINGFKVWNDILNATIIRHTALNALQGPKGWLNIAAAIAVTAAAAGAFYLLLGDLSGEVKNVADAMNGVAANTEKAVSALVKFDTLKKKRMTIAERVAESERLAVAAGFAPSATPVRITARPIGSQAGGQTNVIDEVRKSNEILTKIEANTREGGVEINEVSL